MNSSDFAREYLHKPSMGNKEDCISAALKVQAWLNQQYDNGIIQGWETNYIDDPSTLEQRFIFIDISAISDISYPFLHLSVQVEETFFKEIDKVVKEFGFFKVE
ncbi:hypothetical protein EXU57_06705 [Segetibacter sp. 3557_3]|uniref:hypothetical protein n=1 Tax=Segetibacter sp. 3557_3 TaxID=2547429 RepID=UPI0010585B5F|nr:hypothetical protein [Segetibacter sp. 3557_3]TDH27275.1 hypothetical protein EXU57_06705 [Segetibacter sp. 3557_3]